MSTLKDRMTLAIAEKGCTKGDLARAAGVKPPSVSNWLGGQTLTLKAVPASRDAKFLGVEVRWLAEGLGPMRAEGSDDQQPDDEIIMPEAAAPTDPAPGLYAVEQRTVSRPPLTRDEQAVLDGYRVAGEQDKKRVKEICVTALFDHGHREGEAQKKA